MFSPDLPVLQQSCVEGRSSERERADRAFHEQLEENSNSRSLSEDTRDWQFREPLRRGVPPHWRFHAEVSDEGSQRRERDDVSSNQECIQRRGGGTLVLAASQQHALPSPGEWSSNAESSID